ncbi:SAM-dependent DNA methyltransferase [Parashewanella spongiae]|uniref:site-specific DNA-methyltransferase (adenine-specific) n=1 Tax=Parashewanella spongiae TaxID=342950 RepID=A0A3A6UN21_9GAMM|nr:class I SAM-dependent DNA methyltransferase [Parashewanella spongiae]MCL1076918.1 type I restriction-modification system subunit M [Parashewanella spongiae]RJY19168.1 SAM-dependent DNA methyltransferase [Parashewanella spongiae]USN27179.1 type I restriction-modification system subunit M [synthetic construct]
MSSSHNNLAAFIWSVADLLRGDFKQSQYGRIILPFTLLRRLECVLEVTKDDVVAQHEKVKAMSLPEDGMEKMLLRAAKLSFFNISPMNLSKMGQGDIKDNLENYVQSFSKDAREIFEHFKFDEFVGTLNEANLLFKVVRKFANIDLSPTAVSNHEMGLVFEELIRRFAESSNETAGEHFTPRDIVELTTSLVFMEDDDALTKEGIVRSIYDPTAGTGGFLSAGMEYVYKHNAQARMTAFGQELNPESYAICKADMLIKGQDVSRIKLGNTLSNDHLVNDKFDYMLSNPPFGVDWKKIESSIKDEHTFKGFDGRFGAGLPRVSDGSLLFLMHLISKFKDAPATQNAQDSDTPSRIGIILNGSPLFTGSAGSGESEIRRYILESDLLEAIVALPTDMFYNTGIATYVWVLSNKKSTERKGKVQLINGVDLYGKMRKSLGSKRNIMSDADIKTITRCYGGFEAVEQQVLDKTPEQKSNRGRQSANPKQEAPKTFASKIFDSHKFGYRRITVERPLRLSAQITDEAVASLRFAPKPFNAVMRWMFETFPLDGKSEYQTLLADNETAIRTKIKADFKELKEKQIKEVLSDKLWLFQKGLMEKAQKLQTEIGTQLSNDFNQLDSDLKAALKATNLKLEAKEKKQFLDAVTFKNPAAQPVIKKVLKEDEQPLYGAFTYNGTIKEYQGKVVEYQTDGDLRDNENIPLDPSVTTTELIETYFKREVAPHVPDAWINADKRDEQDKEIGIVGYEIPFNRHFYVYQPPRKLEEIDADLDAVSKRIMKLLAEVHS